MQAFSLDVSFPLKLPSLWLPMPLLLFFWSSFLVHTSHKRTIRFLTHFFFYRSFKNRAWPFYFYFHFILCRLRKNFSHQDNHLALSVPFCSPRLPSSSADSAFSLGLFVCRQEDQTSARRPLEPYSRLEAVRSNGRKKENEIEGE